MSRPPENIEASDLWIALTSIPRPFRLVPIPRNLPGTRTSVGDVAMWPLTQEEQQESNAAADEHVRRLFKDPQKKDEINLGYQHSFANEVAVQHLYRACRDPKDVKRPAFPAPKLIRQTLTADEVGVLYNNYLTVQAEIGPIVATMTDEEFEAWVRRLAEGGSALPFDSLSWELQRTLVLTMASRLASSWTATSSAGSPPDDTSPVPGSEQPSSSEPQQNEPES